MYDEEGRVNQDNDPLKGVSKDVFRRQFWKKDQDNDVLIEYAYNKFIARETDVNKKIDDVVNADDFPLKNATILKMPDQ